MAQGAARRGGDHPHRRPRRRLDQRGCRGPRDQGRRLEGVRRRCPRDVHPAVRLACAPGECHLPGCLPAGDRPRPPAARPAAGGGGPEGGRRRGRPRLHRQGQRPGPLRRRGPCAGSRPRGRGADARRDGPDPRAVDRLCERAGHRAPDHEGVPLLHRRQPLGPLLRDRRPRGPVGDPARRRVRVDRGAVGRARPARHRHRLRGRHPGLARRRGPGLRRAGPAAARPGRRARRRPDRPCRGPPRRHQEPRDLRGPRGRDPAHRAPRPRGHRPVQGAAAVQPPGRGRAGPDHLRRPLVQRPVARPAGVRDVVPARGVGRRPHPPRPRPGIGHRAALPAVPVRQEPGDLRRGRRLRPCGGRRVHRDLRPAAPRGGGPARRGGQAPRRRVDVDGTAPRRPARRPSPRAPGPGPADRRPACDPGLRSPGRGSRCRPRPSGREP